MISVERKCIDTHGILIVLLISSTFSYHFLNHFTCCLFSVDLIRKGSLILQNLFLKINMMKIKYKHAYKLSSSLMHAFHRKYLFHMIQTSVEIKLRLKPDTNFLNVL